MQEEASRKEYLNHFIEISTEFLPNHNRLPLPLFVEVSYI